MKSSALYLFYARYFWHPLAVTLPHLTQHIFILSLPIHLQLCPLHLNKNSQPLYQVHAQYWHCILPSIFQWYISIIHPTSTYSLNLNTRLTSYSAYFKSVLPSVRHGYSIPYGYGSRGMSGTGLLRSFVNFVTQGYKGTVGSSREFRHLMTKEV